MLSSTLGKKQISSRCSAQKSAPKLPIKNELKISFHKHFNQSHINIITVAYFMLARDARMLYFVTKLSQYMNNNILQPNMIQCGVTFYNIYTVHVA